MPRMPNWIQINSLLIINEGITLAFGVICIVYHPWAYLMNLGIKVDKIYFTNIKCQANSLCKKSCHRKNR